MAAGPGAGAGAGWTGTASVNSGNPLSSNFNPNYKIISAAVTEICNRYKAVLEFSENGHKQRALLKVEKMSCKPQLNPDGIDLPIHCYVAIGTIVKCLCHKFDESGEHRCAWYVADVLSVGLGMIDPKLLKGLCPTMFNRLGIISQLNERQGIITFFDECNTQHDVLFLASKTYVNGKRVAVKHSLSESLRINDNIYFDAVPVDLEANQNKFAWFASIAWKHTKPNTDYDSQIKDTDPTLSMIKTIIRNPKSQFIRGKGQILSIPSSEYGLALGLVNDKGNHWQSILFHRSHVSIFKFNFKNCDLLSTFQKGDRIRYVAASAPPGFAVQWVASYVGIDVVGEAGDLINAYMATSEPGSKSEHKNSDKKNKGEKNKSIEF
ncbi:hypothetical protein ONE63_002796 [Megalurothrips usitatus]|uniref:Uncharacterized protein n=1 Tax=Megalurothrips usitatus TaxID=439358 RepID=A0AAV7X5C5_9NEOP|nr:hypothetical protein ONE63_002796 [Megalurothrips usitatus]